MAETNAGVQLRLSGKDAIQSASSPAFPFTPYGSFELPLQFVTVKWAVLQDTDIAGASTARPAIRIQHLQSRPWDGEIQKHEKLSPPAIGWEPIPALLPDFQQELPTEPLFLLRQGSVRGQPIAVIAFSQLYLDATSGTIHIVTELDAEILNAELLPKGSQPISPPPFDTPPAPTNPFLAHPAVKIFVDQPGIHRLTPAALASVGLATPPLATVRLFHRGTEIPLHVVDTNGNGLLDEPGDALYFYAPSPGDRWNVEDIYWLVSANQPGLRMGVRAAYPGGAPPRTTAIERGVWADNQHYQSLAAGMDGDHWFHLDAEIDPASQLSPSEYLSTIAQFQPTLPLAHNAPQLSSFTLELNVYDRRSDSAPRGTSQWVPHRLELQAGSFNHTDDFDDWVVDFTQGVQQDSTHTFSTTAALTELNITFLPGDTALGIRLDKISWQQPVTLDLTGNQAAFSGVPGNWTYRLANPPSAPLILDVTDPKQPIVLITSPGQTLDFQDGPAVHDYFVSGDGAYNTPRLMTHSPADINALINAHALYIAPAEFHPALEPLLQHRTAQGYQAKGVDVQTLYDAWSYGEVDPTAIRNFLRYAVAHGNPAPIAAVLVGDGTWDPHDYQGYGISNAIPPYMADVDPWLGETACENCYAQLDGDDPLSESAFLTDIWLGRFPVITVSELETVVAKIIAYETAIDLNAPLGAPWRGITVQLADNYIRHNGQTDPAGNFPGFVEGILAMQPPQMHARRHYYNPAVSLDSLQPNIATLLQSISRWLEPDPVLALRKSIAYMNDGASLVTFTGHGNHWKWATTDPASTEGRLFGLWDVLQLQNKEKLFIALSMTCYTAQFPKPEAYHFTLDEHLLLHPNGGAVAVWGPAGLSVAHGHDALQTGFYTALWQAEPYSAKLGALIQAGYRHLVTKSICCQDVARTFLLLGDPLTPALVNPVDVSYMPEISTRPLAQ